MLELLITFLINIVLLFWCFYGFYYFKLMKVYFIFIQIFLNLVFCRNNIINKENYLSFKKYLNFEPISEISASNNRDDLINIEYLKDRRYSLIKTKIYSKECLPNYYIKESYECPITDIILEKNKSNVYNNYKEIKLINGKYLYYSNKNFSGKLYGQLYYSPSSDNIKCDGFYTSGNFTKYKIINDLKISNPIFKYNYYAKHIYLFLSFLFLCLAFYCAIESTNPCSFNYFKIYSYIIEIIILILEILRFKLFLKAKYFSFIEENKDFVKDIAETYSKFINIESFSLSMEVVKILIEILHMLKIFPQKCHGNKNYDVNYYNNKYFFFNKNEDKKFRILYFFLPLYIFYLIYFSLDILNDNEIKKKYDYLEYNWKTSPITSIEISSNKNYPIGQITTKENKYKLYEWKDSYFKIERLKHLDYINIYKKENGKLCGKDSFENNLYFPEDIECPINDIIISNDKNIEGYKKLPLGEKDTYLYYTNKKVDKSIIIDIRANYKDLLQLNLDKSNDLCISLKGKVCKDFYYVYLGDFYEDIDSCKSVFFLEKNINKSIEYSSDYINLNLIKYLGINSSIIYERGNFSSFQKNMHLFTYMITFKYVSIIINLLAIIILNLFLILKKNNLFQFIISILFLILIIGIIKIYYISLNINIKYVKNFMDKINIYFQYHKNDYFYSISIFINQILIFISLLIIIIFTYCFKKSDISNNDDLEQENNTEIEIINNISMNEQKSNVTPIDIKIDQKIFQNESDSVDTQKNYNNGKKRLCVYCLVNKTKIILYPCLHRCCCEKCYAKLKNNLDDIKICPICGINVIKVIDKVYDI